MSTESTSKSGGATALGLLGIVFTTLKLLGITEVATWSWLWVLAPFWIGAAVAVACVMVICLIAVILTIFDK